MKHLIIFLISCCIFQNINAQNFPQIRLKTGGSILFPSPGSKGYAFRPYPGSSSSVVLGGEFSHPLKNKSGAWHVGFTFQDGDSNPYPNDKNLIPGNLSPQGFGFSFLGAPAKTVIYGGFEKYINKSATRPSKNYFSVVGGVGLAFTLNKLNDWQYSTNQQFQTRDGRIVEGYTSTYSRPRFPVAPSIYAGLRYNITNKKGNEVVIIELLANYGLSPYYRQNIDYTINGQQYRDVLREKGFNAQLNIIVPLYSFKKKRTF